LWCRCCPFISSDRNQGGFAIAAYEKSDTIPPSYAPPWNVFTNQENFEVVVAESSVGPNDDVTLSISVDEPGLYIYKDFYVYRNTQADPWVKYTFAESPTLGQYISGSASANFERAVSTLDEENWVLSYSCMPNNQGWLCGCRGITECGKWSIQRFGRPSLCSDDPDCVSRSEGDRFCKTDKSQILECTLGQGGCLEATTVESCAIGSQCTLSGSSFTCANCVTTPPDPDYVDCGPAEPYTLCSGGTGSVTGRRCPDLLECVDGVCTDTCSDDSGCVSTSSIGCEGNAPFTCDYYDGDSCLDKNIGNDCGLGTCNQQTGDCDPCVPSCGADQIDCGEPIPATDDGCGGTCEGTGMKCEQGSCSNGECVTAADENRSLCEDEDNHFFDDPDRWGLDGGFACCGDVAGEYFRQHTAYWNFPWEGDPSKTESVACCDEPTDCVTGASGPAACLDDGNLNSLGNIVCDAGIHYRCINSAVCQERKGLTCVYGFYTDSDEYKEWQWIENPDSLPEICDDGLDNDCDGDVDTDDEECVDFCNTGTVNPWQGDTSTTYPCCGDDEGEYLLEDASYPADSDWEGESTGGDHSGCCEADDSCVGSTTAQDNCYAAGELINDWLCHDAAWYECGSDSVGETIASRRCCFDGQNYYWNGGGTQCLPLS
jgi:hypothetical protein